MKHVTNSKIALAAESLGVRYGNFEALQFFLFMAPAFGIHLGAPEFVPSTIGYSSDPGNESLGHKIKKIFVPDGDVEVALIERNCSVCALHVCQK